MTASPAVERLQEGRGELLPMETPKMGVFNLCGKKQLYLSCVKVLNQHSLAGTRESRCTQVFASDYTLTAGGGSCMPPVEKQVPDL